MLEAGFWILDFKEIFLSPLKTGSSTSIPDESGFPLSSNKHPATSISALQPLKLITVHKLAGLRRSFDRNQEKAFPMERTLFDKNGEAVAYIMNDYHETVYMWNGSPVAYLYNDEHVYGINGRHLGRFINGIIYDAQGERIGFTSSTCPVTIAKEPVKTEKRTMDEIRPRWSAPPLPKLTFNLSNRNLADFLMEGRVVRFHKEASAEDSSN